MTIDINSLVFSKLSNESDVSLFTCSGSEHLHEFLRDDAKTDQLNRMSVTYLVHLDNRLVSYYTLSMGCIASTDVKKMTLEVEDPPSKFPALLLGKMATIDDMQSKGIGGAMLVEIFDKALDLADHVGCRFIKVDARNDERTIRFYETNGGFIKLSSNQKTTLMVLDITKIPNGIH